MPDWPIWVWILIVAIILLAVIAIVAGASRKRDIDRTHADELRTRAAGERPLLDAQERRADDFGARAENLQSDARVEAERAEQLRREAEAAQERATSAEQEAQIMDNAAQHSKSELDETRKRHDDMVREADRRDPDVRTDRDGNRLDQADARADRDPDEDLRLADDGRPMDDTLDADEPDYQPAADQQADGRGTEFVPRDEQGRRLDPYGNAIEEIEEVTIDEQGRRLDPYGNPVASDDVPRDEQGRRLDPYGNPVADDPR